VRETGWWAGQHGVSNSTRRFPPLPARTAAFPIDPNHGDICCRGQLNCVGNFIPGWIHHCCTFLCLRNAKKKERISRPPLYREKWKWQEASSGHDKGCGCWRRAHCFLLFAFNDVGLRTTSEAMALNDKQN